MPTMLKKTDGALSPSMRRKAKRLLRTKVLTCRQIATGLGVPAQAVRALKAWEKRPRRSRVTPQPESETELLPVERKTGEEPFAYADGTPLGVRLRDFWVWANSELLCNALRGRLAEYIVACATRADTARCRREWEPFDVTTCEGIAVEVKSAAYVQAWCQPKATKPVFQIAKKRRLHKDGRWLGGSIRHRSMVYVFALLEEKDRMRVDPLNLGQWGFYVLSTAKLEEELGEQKSVSLTRLGRLNVPRVEFSGLHDAVRRAAGAVQARAN